MLKVFYDERLDEEQPDDEAFGQALDAEVERCEAEACKAALDIHYASKLKKALDACGSVTVSWSSGT